MNINCIICSDLFIPTSAIYITRCGHIFHYTCLIQWIERSKTCPQCRNKTNEKTIFRVFLNIVTQEGAEDDAVTLQNKLDTTNLQLRLKQSEMKSLQEKYNEKDIQNDALQTLCEELQKDLDKSKLAFNSIKDQIQFYKERSKCLDKMEKEIVELKTNLNRKEQELKGITGDLDEFQDIISSNHCPKTLATIATSLKRELQLIQKKKHNYFMQVKRLENELHANKKELEDVKQQLKVEQNNMLSHQHCKTELESLREKITELMNSNKVVDPSLVRIATESPAPAKKPRYSDSPTIEERVKKIKESESPYLRVKSSHLGILQARPATTLRYGSDNISIFKNIGTSSTIDISKPIPEYDYDGFGGHSKEDKFPVPRKDTGLKRTKTMSSSKFKKLARPNKKLDEFFSLSQI